MCDIFEKMYFLRLYESRFPETPKIGDYPKIILSAR